MSAESQAQSLLDAGYTEVTEHNEFEVGCRVRHVGEQYSAAMRDGTGVIERIFIRSRRGIVLDVELIVRRDKPKFSATDTHGYWANYHTVVIP